MHMQYVTYIDDIVYGKMNTRENKSTACQMRLLQCDHYLSLCHNESRHICKEGK